MAKKELKNIFYASIILIISIMAIKNYDNNKKDFRSTYLNCQLGEMARYIQFMVHNGSSISKDNEHINKMRRVIASSCGLEPPIENHQLMNPYGFPYETHITNEEIFVCTKKEKARFFSKEKIEPFFLAFKVNASGTISLGDECSSDSKNLRIRNVLHEMTTQTVRTYIFDDDGNLVGQTRKTL
jgi:hypothetical protein